MYIVFSGDADDDVVCDGIALILKSDNLKVAICPLISLVHSIVVLAI